MAKFIKAAFKKDMINVSGMPEPWYDCDKAVKGYASKFFKEGDDIELSIEQRNGKPFVTRVSKPGGQQSQSQNQEPAQTQSQGSTSSSSSSSPSNGMKMPSEYSKPFDPSTAEVVLRQSTMASAAQAATVLTGAITDSGALTEVVIRIYKAMLAEIKTK